LNSSAFAQKNIRSITEFESWELFVYWVGTWLINADNSRLKLLATFYQYVLNDKNIMDSNHYL